MMSSWTKAAAISHHERFLDNTMTINVGGDTPGDWRNVLLWFKFNCLDGVTGKHLPLLRSFRANVLKAENPTSRCR